MNTISHWVNGKVLVGTSGRTGVIWNPATGEQAAAVDLASVAEVDHAVESVYRWLVTSYHFTPLPLPVPVIAQSTVPRSSAV